jgi:hypothetical protein
MHLFSGALVGALVMLPRGIQLVDELGQCNIPGFPYNCGVDLESDVHLIIKSGEISRFIA